ncbi:arabinogalactan endo-1,4-beta-galactosidase [Natronobacillus azotifigens]|uniref:Arabinogalactan endo-beta-1,4-galactanase n=1 Tax=Natronobacillus azotifigens TaxID=472978 RepID=A0A9J6R947_9BACI|nr:glycosyl hydrolase 53 family protein [Natronobacillus azotifigens]MCZ0702141.1 glycosyl hydrolase 53 family protein [Natronobacillus azotifigens]
MEQIEVKGVDVSTLNEVELLGGGFYVDGEKQDFFRIVKNKGINTVRLKLWVDPYDENGDPYLGGTNDLKTTLALAKRAKDVGMAFMLNLHYSDFWVDPKKQTKPKKWRSISGKALEEQVYLYTKEVLQTCEANDLLPEYIQIGNEITNGMLWPDGKTPYYIAEERKFETVDEETRKMQYDALVGLLKAGVRATREVCSAKIIIHLDFGGADDLYRKWFDEITKRELDYDIIGLSYYPYWHGDLQALAVNLKQLGERYDKDLLVVETAYGFTEQSSVGSENIFTKALAEKTGYSQTVEGQTAFLEDLIEVVKNANGTNYQSLGIVYWEPAWLPVKHTSWASESGMKYANDIANRGNHWANQGLFDFEGNALKSLNVFQD